MLVRRTGEEKQEESGEQPGTKSSNRGSLEENGRGRFLSIRGVYEQREMTGDVVRSVHLSSNQWNMLWALRQA